MLLKPDHLVGTSVKFSATIVKNMVIMQINARKKFANIVRPLVTLLKNVRRRLEILLPATMHR